MMMMMMIRLTCDPHLSQNMYKNINVKTVERDKSGPVIPRSQFGGYEQTIGGSDFWRGDIWAWNEIAKVQRMMEAVKKW